MSISITPSQKRNARRSRNTRGSAAPTELPKVLPIAPISTSLTVYAPAVKPPAPKNRKERREEYANTPEVRKYYIDKARREKQSQDIKKVVADPVKGLYLSSDPTTKFAECRRCSKRFEILKGSPLLEESVQRLREEEWAWWLLDPENECPGCSYSHKSLGWCIIQDSLDVGSDEEDEEVERHTSALKDGKKDGETAFKEYSSIDPQLRSYMWSHRGMCLCTNCIRTFELLKYDAKLKAGEEISKYLRDPDHYVQPPFRMNGIKYYY